MRALEHDRRIAARERESVEAAKEIRLTWSDEVMPGYERLTQSLLLAVVRREAIAVQVAVPHDGRVQAVAHQRGTESDRQRAEERRLRQRQRTEQ